MSDNNIGDQQGIAAELASLRETMRTWRAAPAPAAPEDKQMTPEMASLLGCETPEGRASYQRLSAWRAAGYDGPLDENANIPDPDDPTNIDRLATLAHLARVVPTGAVSAPGTTKRK
ncbi:hypothetical protein AB0J47_41915 [Nocardia sp. NPDC049737]|uniref:hypothetical protein n=1 Tax=Nocardia sp. NPDC049737 TaxID=3154358 RepID=UPI0034242B92